MTNIAITGPENSGKSVLNDALQVRIREHSYKLPEPSTDAERDLITIGKWSKVVTVIPGQEVRQKDVWQKKAFSENGRLAGVVFVANWGYMYPRSKAVREKFLKEAPELQRLRTKMLSAEADEFRKICVEIRKFHQVSKRPVWFIVAVSKADLYYDRLSDAESYYSLDAKPSSKTLSNGTRSFYSIYRDEIAQRVGSDNIRATSLPVSSFVENFEWGDEVARGSISDADRRALLNHFIATMNIMSA